MLEQKKLDKDLVWAANKGYLAICKILVGRFGADVTVEDNRPLKLAAENGHLEVVKYLESEIAKLKRQ